MDEYHQAGLDNEVICFTGKSPKPRKEMTKIANQAGATVSNSITKKVTILVMGNLNSTSSKAVKARALGIQLITPETFLQLAENMSWSDGLKEAHGMLYGKNSPITINKHTKHHRKDQQSKKQGPPRRRVILDK